MENPKGNLVQFGSEKFELSEATESKFFQGTRTSRNYKQMDPEMFLFNIDSASRQGDSLIFIAENGIQTILINTKNTADDAEASNAIYYRFFSSLAGFHEVSANSDLNSRMILVNKKTGDTTHTEGISAISPSGKYLLTANPDVFWDDKISPVELFEIRNDKLVLIGRQKVNNWTPYSILWLSDDRILLTVGTTPKDRDDHNLDHQNVELNRLQ
ncbi:MAG: hypothetical protein GQ574_16210 [Crocinitomix sp.]|nr:hypothetical protein [Crocinitomix sp.]